MVVINQFYVARPTWLKVGITLKVFKSSLIDTKRIEIIEIRAYGTRSPSQNDLVPYLRFNGETERW